MTAAMVDPGSALGRGRFVIRGARLLDGRGGTARRDPLVVIEDGLITAVEDATRQGDPGCPVVEPDVAPGRATLLPGFVDAHMHLAWVAADGDQDRAALLLVAADRAASTLAGGVTTARDLGGPGDVTLRLRGAIADGVVTGPRLLVAGPPITTPAGHCHWLGRHARTAPQVRRLVAELAELGVDVVKLMLTGGMATPSADPAALQVPVAAARAAVDEAHRHGLPVAAHALGTPGVRAAITAGVDTLEHGWTITGREQHYDPAVVPELARTPIVASVSAHHALRGLVPRQGETGDLAELERRLVPHRTVRAAGVPVVVHSDPGAGPTRYDGFGQSLVVFALGMHVDPAAAVRAGTLEPARALGLEARIGTAEPGRVADLVVIDGDPEADVHALERVMEVYQGGCLVARAGRILRHGPAGLPAASPPSGRAPAPGATAR